MSMEPVVLPSENGAKPPPVDQKPGVPPSENGAAPTPVDQKPVAPPSENGAAATPVKSKSPTAPAPKPSDPVLTSGANPEELRDSRELEPRARLEDFFLWVVIALVLGYLAWYLSSATTGFMKIADVERLAVYGMNVREGLVLLIGGALALLGCMIVLRRVRMSFAARAQFETARVRVVADSAGVVIVLLGVFLLAVVVTHPPQVERSGSVVQSTTPPSGLEERLQQLKTKQANEPVVEPGTPTDGGVE